MNHNMWWGSVKVAQGCTVPYNENSKNTATEGWINVSCSEGKHGKCCVHEMILSACFLIVWHLEMAYRHTVGTCN